MGKQNCKFQGIPASPGKFLGPCLKIISSDHVILENSIQRHETSDEIKKFHTAAKKTKLELENIISKNSLDLNENLQAILEAQIFMVEDPVLLESVKNRIEKYLENAATALFHSIEKISKDFESISDQYFQERAEDIRDIGKRIEKNLLGTRSDEKILSSLNKQVILVSKELTPSQILNINKFYIKGIATEKGGRTGHMAILARHFGIPAVLGLKNIHETVEKDGLGYIDGDNGVFVYNPAEIQKKLFSFEPIDRTLQSKAKLSKTTLDSEPITILANAESQDDIIEIKDRGFDGIGLYRSEMILLGRKGFPSEEDQFIQYAKMTKSLNGKTFVLRTFDIGGDKSGEDFVETEENPFLGNRGIRYFLRNKDLFRQQIRAILRASQFGPISILLPMISYMNELRQAKTLIRECERDLHKKGIETGNIKIGPMIETPACIFILDSLAKESDFFCVGSNDLLQYIVAVDRNSSILSDLYNPFHFGFLKSLEKVARFGRENNFPVSICGEIASDTNFTMLLIGMGFRSLSISVPTARKVAKIISGSTVDHCLKLYNKVIDLSAKEKYQELEAHLFHKHLL